MRAVLLAGGKGTRLQPFTAAFPKPLVPLGDTPVIEILLNQLHQYRIGDVTVVTGHLAELIKSFLGDGSRFGVKIKYFKEETPLDTAGCLGLLPRAKESFLVMNGDLLTTFDFRQMIQFHKRRKPLATIATYPKQVKIDLGVVETDEAGRLVEYHEKPTHTFYVSMGIYCFEPAVRDYIEPGERITMPALILRLRDAGEKVLCYRQDCYWLDIGRPDDYATAIEEFGRDKSRFYRRKAA